MQIKTRDILIAVDFLTLLLILVIIYFPNSPARVALGLPMVLLFPGYTLIAALFPRKGAMDSIEKLALSVGLSVAVVPLIGLGLNYTTWGIRLDSIMVSLTIFIGAMSLIAFVRQFMLPKTERPSVTVSRLSWSFHSTADKVVSIILAVAVVAAIGALVYVIGHYRSTEKFTEFYILGANGKAEDYPTSIALGNSANVTLGIVNHEGAETSYRVEVTVDGTLSQTVGPVVLQPGQKYEHPVAVTPTQPGPNQEVQFLLYKPPQTTTYLEVHFWLAVTGPGGGG